MNQSILIIDDSAAIHSLLRARLKDEPLVLHSATTGEQGLEMAGQIVPDLILLDVEMPSPDGFEVCRRLKNDPKLMNIPIVFLTGVTSSEQKIRGLDLGAMDYVTKPFDPAELRARVRATLRYKFLMDLLAQKAQIDGLTGLWNRRYFDQRLEADLSLARRANRPLAVLMIDIDHFKAINDRFGHPSGDHVLRIIAQTLSESVRVEDVLCRYGGEEFAIIAPNIDSGAAHLAARLRDVIEKTPVLLRGQAVNLTVSIGVAASGEPSQSMVVAADQALHRAKQQGRNRVEVARPVPVAA